VETTLEKVLAVQPQNGWSPPAANHSDSGTPVLTLSSVTGFYFRPDKLKFTSASTDSRRHYWVKNGDFLITRSNTPELVGHVAIASGINEPTIYPDLIMRMNPSPDRMMAISARFNSKQQAFLDFVLAHYVGVGVDELDQEKLTPLLRLKYLNSIADAIADLGRPEEISKVFVGFQKYLYQPTV
jgi:hypothetical protein